MSKRRKHVSAKTIIVEVLRVFGQEEFGSAEFAGMQINKGRPIKTTWSAISNMRKAGLLETVKKDGNKGVYRATKAAAENYAPKVKVVVRKKPTAPQRTTPPNEFLVMAKNLLGPHEYIKLLEGMIDDEKLIAVAQSALRKAMDANLHG